MKIIQDYTIKVIILIFCLVLSLEICICIFIYINSKNIYKEIFDDTLEKSAKKAKESMETVTKFIQNLLMIYITKLKLINKHIYLYNRNFYLDNENTINKNSKISKNKNLQNKIIEANTDSIHENKVFQNLFNETKEKFEYIEYYNKIYENITDKNILLNKLSKEHEELNYISYYNYEEDDYDFSYLEEEIQEINFLIPIFKSIFLEQFITKREKMDINRIFILTPFEIIIYPPEDAFKIDLYHPESYEDTGDLEGYEYYDYIYNYINDDIIEYDDDILLRLNYDDFNNLLYSICLKIFYLGFIFDYSFLCFDINFGYLVNNIGQLETKKFDFGFLKEITFYNDSIDYDYFVIYNTNRKVNEVIEVFNDSQYTPDQFVIEEDEYNYYSLYHVLYLETTKIFKSHPELNINISEIKKEYDIIRQSINDSYYQDNSDIFQVKFNKTTCRKKLDSNEYECFICELRMSYIFPFYFELNEINEDIVDNNETKIFWLNSLPYSITYTCPEMNSKDMELLIKIKLIRIISFYVFITFIIFCLYLIFINILSEYFFSNINDLNNKINSIEINEKTSKIQLIKNDKDFHPNNEMLNLDNIYELLSNSILIKEMFDNENFFEKHKLEFIILLNNIKNKNVKEICNYFFGIFLFNNNLVKLSEDKFKSAMIFINENEKKIKNESLIEYEKIKDEIKKSSNVPYLNEYSVFENIDENMLDVIYLNIYKQRLFYFYAMTKYKLANAINNENNDNVLNLNKKRNKRYKEKRDEYLNEAIKFFKECKNINISFGINQIKIIYSLIMISKCYLHLKDYKNAIININEALNLYFRFSKIFNDYHSTKYNPKMMLFVETNIFQNILFNISNICATFHKPCVSNIIAFNIFNTSPFILSNVHYPAGIKLFNFFDKNKNNMRKYDKDFLQNTYFMKEYDKTKKYLTKIVSRLYVKTSNNENIKEINTKSIKNQTIKDNNMSKLSSNLNASKYKSLYTSRKNRRLSKNITFCIIENILEKINFEKFKDVIIRFLKKYFTTNDKDTFGFIQFGINGLKTKVFLSQPLNQFINKFNNVKKDFVLNDKDLNNKNKNFIGIYDIFETIINNYQKTEERDNIIMLFIDAQDIRLSSVIDCLNIVETLNENNTSVFFFCFNEIIEEKKINNIQSFLNGLIEGYFFQIKNFQLLNEIFLYLSTNNNQTNFFNYNYDLYDHNL